MNNLLHVQFSLFVFWFSWRGSGRKLNWQPAEKSILMPGYVAFVVYSCCQIVNRSIHTLLPRWLIFIGRRACPTNSCYTETRLPVIRLFILFQFVYWYYRFQILTSFSFDTISLFASRLENKKIKMTDINMIQGEITETLNIVKKWLMIVVMVCIDYIQLNPNVYPLTSTNRILLIFFIFLLDQLVFLFLSVSNFNFHTHLLYCNHLSAI